MTDTQYKPSTDRNEEYKESYSEKLRGWQSHLGFRTMVYCTLLVFLLLHIAVVSQLIKNGAVDWPEGELSFVFSAMGLLVIGFALADLFKGISYLLISKTGKHRAYLLVSAVLTVAVWLAFTQEGQLPETDADAYKRLAWIVALIVGLNYLPGALFKRDFDRLRSVIGS